MYEDTIHSAAAKKSWIINHHRRGNVNAEGQAKIFD